MTARVHCRTLVVDAADCNCETDIDCIANGKVVECWTNADGLGLLQQLAVVPAPEHVG
jgi:hypothetical protein